MNMYAEILNNPPKLEKINEFHIFFRINENVKILVELLYFSTVNIMKKKWFRPVWGNHEMNTDTSNKNFEIVKDLNTDSKRF